MKALLQEAINRYYASDGEAERPSQETNHVTGIQQQSSVSPSGVVTTPPPIVRAQAVINIRTSASSISTISGSRYDQYEMSEIESERL
jgi:hypothetical protein